MLKQRQKEVLFFLRGMEGYTSAEVIAGAMGCSVKTIRNDLQTIRDFLEERYHTTIVAKPNCGVRLAAGQDAWEKIQADFDMPGNAQKRPYDGNQEEWRDVAALLLRKTDVTLRDLEQMLYCSRSVAEKRLSEAQAWLEEQGLSVLRKRGMGIFLEGSEFCRTIALWRVWAMGLMALPGGWNSPGGQGFSGGVLQKAVSSFFSGFSPGGVEDVIVAVEKEHGLRFNFESYARLLFLTSFVLFQHRQSGGGPCGSSRVLFHTENGSREFCPGWKRAIIAAPTERIFFLWGLRAGGPGRPCRTGLTGERPGACP